MCCWILCNSPRTTRPAKGIQPNAPPAKLNTALTNAVAHAISPSTTIRPDTRVSGMRIARSAATCAGLGGGIGSATLHPGRLPELRQGVLEHRRHQVAYERLIGREQVHRHGDDIRERAANRACP